ncbi:hypothetical protein O4J56_09140 [Nocardiopsis sp. RSe5-2]|uniref:Uncharacterized protein n=1 Tax=Nocardiopsis endophytica TaxID=3018445 RepID=A0ABT4U1F6_9ACTN|nr:hypothetical protein [Nocardiopsis endophytica]MDA2810797.1 hypothetical protein [Nocardiopsis endophytica]
MDDSSQDPRRSLQGRIGALESWARTADRAARTRRARAASPGSVDYWIARVDPAITGEEQRRKAGEAAHRAYMLRLARASADTRSRRRRAPSSNDDAE